MTSAIFVGESWGEHEHTHKIPFVGSAGQEFARMLAQAGWPIEPPDYRFISAISMIPRWRAFPYPVANVFNLRPLENDIETLYGSAGEDIDRTLPMRKFGSSHKFVLTQYASHVHQLHELLHTERPNLIIALGATATWALGLGTSITKLRGYIYDTEFGKVLPTYHPASVLRKWSQRIITVVDLYKARKEFAFPEIRRISREIWTEPTIEDLWAWWDTNSSCTRLAVDIETLRRAQISEVGFAPSPAGPALHIPFAWQEGKVYHSWWKTAREELEAWQFVKTVCESPIPKITQNGIQFDAYWLAKEMGIVIRNIEEDTMQMTHAWSPEMDKSLNFLGSMFLNEASWKQMRRAVMEDK